MTCHPFDYEIAPRIFSDPEYANIFDEKARLQRWLDFESALAKAQGELGVIPKWAASEVCKKAHLECLDLERLKQEYQRSPNSLVPLLRCLKEACEDGAGQYVHYCATTQDVIDTSQVLELRQVLSLLYKDLRELEGLCIGISKMHADTPMVARTHGQHALPTTFGLKSVIWAQEIRRHIQRLKEISKRFTVGQFGGAAGTLACLGSKAMAVARRTLAHLGLGHSGLPWHNSRDTIGDLACLFALIVTSLERFANEIFQLQKTEIGELKEHPFAKGKMLSSSAMPHKSNPVLCQRVCALSGHVRHLSLVLVESMVHEHERDPRRLWSEWLAVPQISIYTGAVLRYMLRILEGLDVCKERMLQNLRSHGQQLVSEWLVKLLSRELGRMRAMERVRELSQESLETKRSLEQLLWSDPEIAPVLEGKDLSLLNRPEAYVGVAKEMVKQALLEIERLRERDPARLWNEDQD